MTPIETIRALEARAAQARSSAEAAATWLEIGEVHRRQRQDLESAASAFRRAARIDPSSRPAINALAETVSQLERWDELADVLGQASDVARDAEERARVLAHRGDVLGRRLGRLAEARSMYREVARLTGDATLRSAAEATVAQLDELLGDARPARPKRQRERTFVGPLVRRESTAVRPADPAALASRQRREQLRRAGDLDGLVAALVDEAERVEVPAQSRDLLREAAGVAQQAGHSIDDVFGLYRRALVATPDDDQSLADAVAAGAAAGRFDVAQRVLPDEVAWKRAERLEALAQGAEVVGDASAARIARAVAFEDRPDEARFFSARLELCVEAGPRDRAIQRRLQTVTDPMERGALSWELAALRESVGQPGPAADALLLVLDAAGDARAVEEILGHIGRMGGLAGADTWIARALEIVSHRADLPVAARVEWLGRLADVRRDLLGDVEGEAAARAAAAELQHGSSRPEPGALVSAPPAAVSRAPIVAAAPEADAEPLDLDTLIGGAESVLEPAPPRSDAPPEPESEPEPDPAPDEAELELHGFETLRERADSGILPGWAMDPLDSATLALARTLRTPGPAAGARPAAPVPPPSVDPSNAYLRADSVDVTPTPLDLDIEVEDHVPEAATPLPDLEVLEVAPWEGEVPAYTPPPVEIEPTAASSPKQTPEAALEPAGAPSGGSPLPDDEPLVLDLDADLADTIAPPPERDTRVGPDPHEARPSVGWPGDAPDPPGSDPLDDADDRPTLPAPEGMRPAPDAAASAHDEAPTPADAEVAADPGPEGAAEVVPEPAPELAEIEPVDFELDEPSVEPETGVPNPLGVDRAPSDADGDSDDDVARSPGPTDGERAAAVGSGVEPELALEEPRTASGFEAASDDAARSPEPTDGELAAAAPEDATAPPAVPTQVLPPFPALAGLPSLGSLSALLDPGSERPALRGAAELVPPSARPEPASPDDFDRVAAVVPGPELRSAAISGVDARLARQALAAQAAESAPRLASELVAELIGDPRRAASRAPRLAAGLLRCLAASGGALGHWRLRLAEAGAWLPGPEDAELDPEALAVAVAIAPAGWTEPEVARRRASFLVAAAERLEGRARASALLRATTPSPGSAALCRRALVAAAELGADGQDAARAAARALREDALDALDAPLAWLAASVEIGLAGAEDTEEAEALVRALGGRRRAGAHPVAWEAWCQAEGASCVATETTSPPDVAAVLGGPASGPELDAASAFDAGRAAAQARLADGVPDEVRACLADRVGLAASRSPAVALARIPPERRAAAIRFLLSAAGARLWT